LAYKNKEDEIAYKKQWYLRNRDLVKKRAKKNNALYAAELRKIVGSIKQSNPCGDCGNYFHFSAMDFDHVGKKLHTVSRLVNDSRNLSRVLKEISRCELVCANCHRVRTWKRL
jgi:hypothetical protein